jgi:uncharacterized small protein (TIGR04563 family)
MAKQGARKHNFYFPEWMSRELEAEAARLDRSTSWLVQQAWKLAKAEVTRRAPSRSAGSPPGGLGYSRPPWRPGTMPSI